MLGCGRAPSFRHRSFESLVPAFHVEIRNYCLRHVILLINASKQATA